MKGLNQFEKGLFKMSKTTLCYSNFSKDEWQSLRSLPDDRSVVIKKADKGSCVVVWDRNDYIAEAEKHFNNESVYKNVIFKEKELQDLAETSNNIFKSLRGKGKITENQLKYFTIAHKKATNLRKMYLLSKIHKRHFNAPPSRQILVPRTPRGRATPTSQERSLNILFDPRDVTI